MSRLEESSERIRGRLENRNLYTPDDPYKIETPRLLNTINSISNFVNPYNSFDVTNTFAGRITGPRTPIVQIGLQMLGKQFVNSSRSYAFNDFIPQIDPIGALFGGKLFKFPVDYQITRKAGQTLFGKIFEEIGGGIQRNPLPSNATNVDYFKNTGLGQREKLIQSFNSNFYRKSDSNWLSAVQNVDQEYGAPLTKSYFTGKNEELNPFSQYKLIDSIDINNNTLRKELNNFRTDLSTKGGKTYEYGSTQGFIDGLGKTYKKNHNENFDFYFGTNIISIPIENFQFGLDDDPNNRIIWGREGISEPYNSDNSHDGNISDRNANPNSAVGNSTDQLYADVQVGTNNRFNDFNVKGSGLLNYTKELLNAKGKYGNFDLTKKKFINPLNDEISYNGSPLGVQLDGQVNRSRQHNVTDPYNRFVKAIRYNGNRMYGGNENSVIYKSVIPKFHPLAVNGTNKIDIKNMMFSIENLAAKTYRDEDIGVAYLDDQFGTQIPIYEAGDHGGRLMWFAPYDVRLSEQTLSRHETTAFVGRSEPIYTYNYSERLANLSFKLIIDYPPQVRGKNHDETARFFAFGDINKPEEPININDLEKEIKDLEDEKEGVKPEKPLDDRPDVQPPTLLRFHFENDKPTDGEINSIVDATLDSNYEVNGLNSDFENKLEEIINLINDNRNEDDQVLFDIKIVGEATKLYQNTNPSQYNEALGQRRADALKGYLTEKYKEYTDTTIVKDGIIITTSTLGQTRNETNETTDDPTDVNTADSKFYRNASIELIRNANNATKPKTNQDLDGQYYKDLCEKIEDLYSKLKLAKQRNGNGFEHTFNQYTIDDGQWKGFKATSRLIDKFVPCFHSQTPEDFHRRLTFLQQCMRQGNAVRTAEKESNGVTYQGAKNSVFGRQPVQILRLGDFYHTKVIIDNLTIDYTDAPWDMNPEGMGMQFMVADVTLTLKLIGGQSLREPIDALQNAVSFNYYANSTFYNSGIYESATKVEDAQALANENTDNNLATSTIRNAKIEEKYKAIRDLNTTT